MQYPEVLKKTEGESSFTVGVFKLAEAEVNVAWEAFLQYYQDAACVIALDITTIEWSNVDIIWNPAGLKHLIEIASSYRIPSLILGHSDEPGVYGVTDLDQLGKVTAWYAQTPIVRRRLRQELGDLIEGPWLLDGPMDTSYSLAIVNRHLARHMIRQGEDLYLTSDKWEGAAPEPEFAELFPDLLSRVLHPRSPSKELEYLRPAVHMINNYPPKVSHMKGRINVFACGAWEESGYPPAFTHAFNQKLDLITTLSPLIKDIFHNAGIRVPMKVVGCGVDHLDLLPPTDEQRHHPHYEHLDGMFKFLHISSCFPRKGVDVLLKAYGEAFSINDDVVLIIKTFPNPHQNVQAQLDTLKENNPSYPRVILFDEDWPEHQVRELYHVSDAFILPSRAEGFGLPAAEAMLAGLPVIATAHGGHTYFCRPEFSYLIDYQFEFSGSHLGVSDSVWAEPSVSHLVTLLQQMRSLPSEERLRKTAMARTYLLTHFTWEQVAKRNIQAIKSLSHELPNEKKIAWISTWNNNCGVARYSQHLLNYIPQRRVCVLANKNAALIQPDNEHVHRTWVSSNGSMFLDDHDGQFDRSVNPEPQYHEMKATILAEGCRVVMMQQHWWLYCLPAFLEFVEWATQQGIDVFITMHNSMLHDTLHGQPLSEYRDTLSLIRRIFVHTVADLNRLKAAGLVDNVCLFPFGVYPSLDSSPLPRLPRMENKRVIASFGFLLPHKGLQELVHAFADLHKNNQELHLLLLNSLHYSRLSSVEKDTIVSLIHDLGLDNDVTLMTEFISDEDVLAWLRQADMVVFPYQFTEESSSAAVRMALAAEVPAVVTPLEIFKDLESVVYTLPGITPPDIAQGLKQLLELLDNPQWFSAYRERANKWRQEHQWSAVAKRLLGVIDSF